MLSNSHVGFRCVNRLKEAQQRLSAELERRHEAEQRLQATAAELSGNSIFFRLL